MTRSLHHLHSRTHVTIVRLPCDSLARVDVEAVQVIEVLAPVAPAEDEDLPPPLQIVRRVHVARAGGLAHHWRLRPVHGICSRRPRS